MDEYKNNLPKVVDEKIEQGELLLNNNDLRKNLNRYDQHMTNEYSNIGKSLDKHINLQEVTLSKINQIKQNNDAIRYNLAMNDFQKNRFFEDVTYFHSSSMSHLREKRIFVWKNESGSSIYYRLDRHGNKIKCNNDEEILKLFYPDHIKIYEKIEDVIIDDIPILVKNLIQSIRDDAFYPLQKREFFYIESVKYRNLFKSSIYTSNTNDIKLIRIQDVNNKSEVKEVRIPKNFNFHTDQKINKEKKELYWVKKGDFLISLSGAGGFNISKYNGEEGYLNQRIVKVRLKESYKDIFAITCIKTLTVFVIILFYTMTGIY